MYAFFYKYLKCRLKTNILYVVLITAFKINFRMTVCGMFIRGFSKKIICPRLKNSRF